MGSFSLRGLLDDSGLLHFDCVDDVSVINRHRIPLTLDVVVRQSLVILELLATAHRLSVHEVLRLFRGSAVSKNRLRRHV